MRALILTLIVLSIGFGSFAQSLTSKSLAENYDASLNLFFYRNTLRMFNFNDDPEFDKMINGIEKMRFVMLEKEKNNFGKEQYGKLISEYQKEHYEEIMSVRYDNTNFNVFIKEEKGLSKAMLLLANADDSIILLDILGTVPLDKIGDLYNTVSEVNGRGQLKSAMKPKRDTVTKTDH
jgi:hypothetical protein